MVPGSSGAGFGLCNAIPVLQGDAGIDMNNFPIHFAGQQPGSRVGIGTNCQSLLFAKLTVIQSSGLGTSIGENITNSDNATAGFVYGLQSIVNPSNPQFSDVGYIAGYFNANASKNCYGVYSLANGSINGTANYGGFFQAANGGANFGIYAKAIPNGVNYAGWFEGDVYINGIGTGSNGMFYTSDLMFKTNVDSIENVSQIIQSLKPRTFYYDTLNQFGMNFNSQRQYGLIAQDVESILPELVGTASKPAIYDSITQALIPAVTYKTLNYNAFIAILIKNAQEQQIKMDSLTQAITSMQSQINGCCASNARTQNPNANQTDVTLTNSESIVLNQNVPNPFAEQTTITYNLPESVKKAQLLFYDATGKLIKSVDLVGRGNGQINVFANDLSNGIYSYAMVVDGQIVDTKRMVKTQ